MRDETRPGLLPGLSVLGGAAAGFSYDGAMREVLARRAAMARQRGAPLAVPPRQTQSIPSERAVAQQRRQQG